MLCLKFNSPTSIDEEEEERLREVKVYTEIILYYNDINNMNLHKICSLFMYFGNRNSAMIVNINYEMLFLTDSFV